MAVSVNASDGLELLNPQTIRARSHNIFTRVQQGESSCFRLHLEHLELACRAVVEQIRQNYSDLVVPYHSRWRHFEINGQDLSAALFTAHENRLAAKIELVVISVLLDAGAGKDWSYRSVTAQQTFSRSEGLAMASLDVFAAGAFSSIQDEPCRVDAQALSALTATTLARGFQVAADNPLVGLDSRVSLLNRLGQHLIQQCGRDARLADLFTPLTGAVDEITAATILRTVLEATGCIWPRSRLIGEAQVADVWPHRHAGGEGVSAGYVPFHKLSQWLSYSLIEPLEKQHITVTGLDALTGLPEYRNGGLFIDTGVLIPCDEHFAQQRYTVDSEFVVEWRALTVILLDMLAEQVRSSLGLTAENLPLAAVLQGGSWSAGRCLAQEKRGGLPPVEIDSDGTVF